MLQASGSRPAPHRERRITGRQADILALVAGGLTDKEIAERLGISRRTVRTHLEKFFARYGQHNRSGAVAYWLRSASSQH
jgi:DNA-binding CsgD family transcriptional regulator